MTGKKPARIVTFGWVTCSGCGKRAYRSRSQAKKVARAITRRTGENLGVLDAYQCRYALIPAFHVGHARFS